MKSNNSRKQPQPPPHQRHHDNNISYNNTSGSIKQTCVSTAHHQNFLINEFNLIENKKNNQLFYGAEKNKTAGITRNTPKESKINKSNGFKNGQKKTSNNNDYLTMKPIHRAKPFFALSINENNFINDKHPSASRNYNCIDNIFKILF